jgi:hypothetical protein
MAFGSTQPVTEISNRNISLGKDRRCFGLTTLKHSYAECLEIWKPQPPGILMASNRPLYGLLCFTFHLNSVFQRDFVKKRANKNN